MKLWFNPFNQIVIFAVVMVLVLGALMNYILGKPARNEVVSKGAHLQLLEAKTAGIVVRRFLDRVGRSAEVSASSAEIKLLNESSRPAMTTVIEVWADTALEEVVLIDKTGKVLVVENIVGIREGEGVVNVSDREYFKKAMQSGDNKYVVGEPINPRGGHAKGEYVVPVAVPVVVDGQKEGVLLFNVRVGKLAEDYFTQIGISEKTSIYLIRGDGEIMFSDQERLIGINVFERLDELNIVGRDKIKNEIRNALTQKEGFEKIVAPTLDGGFESQVGSYYVVDLGGEAALMVLVTSEKTILGDLGPMYFRRIAVVIIAFLALMVFAIRVAKVTGYYEATRRNKN